MVLFTENSVAEAGRRQCLEFLSNLKLETLRTLSRTLCEPNLLRYWHSACVR